MKKLFTGSVLVLGLISTAAFAHHPAEDNVDPEIWAMIDENVADTPHADLVFDDMGRDADAASDAVEEAASGRTDEAEASAEARGGMDIEPAMEARGEIPDTDDLMDTMTMLDDIEGRLE